jgi:hypothetical protein
MRAPAKFLAGLSIGVAATGVCYAVAATTAAHIGAAVAPEAVRNARMRDHSSAATLRANPSTAIKDWWISGARVARAS